jgi:hypothetical protein
VEDLYTSIYCDTDLDLEMLVRAIASHLRSNVHDRWNINGDFAELSVRDNPDRSVDALLGRYRYYIEIEPKSFAKKSDLIATVLLILDCIQENGGIAETSCDFESEIPGNGRRLR